MFPPSKEEYEGLDIEDRRKKLQQRIEEYKNSSKETTFTADEMAALRVVMEYAANCSNEDIMGAIMYTGAFRMLKANNGDVARLASKIEGR